MTPPESADGRARLSGEPGRAALYTMLAVTTFGTLSGNIINAPLHEIRVEFAVTEAQAVLPVAAYTLGMIAFIPLTGWLADRFGPARIVLAGIIALGLGHVLAVFSTSLSMLVIARLIQGIACAAFPPGVQRTLAVLWPSKGAAVMAAWASAMGVGQALGPPVGGALSELLSWRWVFVFQALFAAVLLACMLLFVPRHPGRPARIHTAGLTLLMLAVTATSLSFTLIGQRAGLVPELIAVACALVGLLGFAVCARRDPVRLVDPADLLEKRYLRATVTAGVSMLIVSVCLVGLPLYLGDRLGLTPGPVGAIVFAQALAMALSGRLNTALAARFGSRRLLEAALIIAPTALLALGAATTGTGGSQALRVTGIVVCLLVIGCALNATQSIAAFGVAQSTTGKNSTAFGIHNTSRFFGLGLGQAWVALISPLGIPLLLYGGAGAAALFALAVVVAGGPAPAQEDDAARR